MYLHQRFVPGLAIASYIVGDESTGRAAVVDPTRDVEPYITAADEQGLRITDILETHVHADYVSGSRELKARFDGVGVTIHASGAGGAAWTPAYADRVVHHRDEVALGQVRLKALHTPGHTPEHLSWAVYDDSRASDEPWLVLTGDFLFVADVGRPDLLGPEAQRELAHQLYASVFDRLDTLPDYVEVYPGHGAGSLCGKAMSRRMSSTLGYERRFNAALQWAGEKQWTASLLQGMPPAPPYFARMKRVNRDGPPVLGPVLPGGRALEPAQVREQIETGAQVLDVRSKEAFAGGHVPGAVHIALDDNLATWAGWVLSDERPIVLVLDQPAQREQAVTQLVRVGLDDVRGHLAGGIDAWQTAGFAVAHVQTVSAPELAARLAASDNGDRPVVVDVRTEAEWHSGHVPGSMSIHAGQIEQRIDELPTDRPIAVMCGSGQRASVAASLLKRAGREQVMNVLGGLAAWRAAGLETVQ